MSIYPITDFVNFGIFVMYDQEITEWLFSDFNDQSPIKNSKFGLLYKKKIKTGFLLKIFSLKNNSARQKWSQGKSQMQSSFFRV